jgi:rfaE bifunctional protein kinase chain/domain
MAELSLEQVFERAEKLTVLVIGDVMIDAYLWGKVDRISPEAPVPVILVTERENRLGGAANVALNIAAMGARPVICAIAGDDEKGKELQRLLEKRGLSSEGILHSAKRPTTVKSRIISGHQHIVRVDEESLKPLDADETADFLDRLESIFESAKPDVVLFEDYNKGLLTPEVIQKATAMAQSRGIPTAVDPKKANFFEYKGVSLFRPNLKELGEGLNMEIDRKNLSSLEAAVEKLDEKLRHEISLVTLSEQGIYVNSSEGSQRIPAHIRDISDVSGAGDTVISVASLCLAIGTSHRFMAALANLAGGLVCEHVGVVPIDRNQLLAEAKKHGLQP